MHNYYHFNRENRVVFHHLGFRVKCGSKSHVMLLYMQVSHAKQGHVTQLLRQSLYKRDAQAVSHAAGSLSIVRVWKTYIQWLLTSTFGYCFRLVSSSFMSQFGTIK